MTIGEQVEKIKVRYENRELSCDVCGMKIYENANLTLLMADGRVFLTCEKCENLMKLPYSIPLSEFLTSFLESYRELMDLPGFKVDQLFLKMRQLTELNYFAG